MAKTGARRTKNPDDGNEGLIMPNYPVIVGFLGLAAAGKTTAAKAVEMDMQHRGVPVHWMPMARRLKAGLKTFGITKEEHKNIYRHLAQFIGTDVLREHDVDWWVNLWQEDVELILETYQNKPCVILVDDIRFLNELEAVRHYDYITMFIHGVTRLDLDQELYKHESEQFALGITQRYLKKPTLVLTEIDYVVDNKPTTLKEHFELKVATDVARAYSVLRELREQQK